MSYFQIDDAFITSRKVKRALKSGAASLQMWLAMRTYVAKEVTDGFVPDDMIDDLDGSPKRPRKWLMVLVECGDTCPDGTRGPGLIERSDGGWVFHDYKEHGLSSEEIRSRKAAARERKERWKERQRNASGTRSAHVPERTTERVPEQSRNANTARAHAGGIPSHPIPSHSATAEAADADGRIPCPGDLDLTPDQRANIAMGMGIPDSAFDELVAVQRAKLLNDAPRTLAQWRKSLVTAITGAWRDPRNRPSKATGTDSLDGWNPA